MIAVVIPAYGRPDDLREALDSLAIQTNKKFITVVVDDATPNDDVKDVCNGYQGKLKIAYLRSEVNMGPGHSRQIGIEWAAKNNIQYVMFLDSDDMYYPQTIERLAYEIQHSMADVVFSSIMRQEKHSCGNIIPAQAALTWCHGKIYSVQYLIYNNIKFEDNLRTNEDLCFNLKAFWATQKKGYLDEPLYLWRDANQSLTRDLTASRIKTVGENFIKAVAYASEYFIEHDIDLRFLLANIITCYNYYELSAIRDTIGEDTEELLTKMISNEKVVAMINDPMAMQMVIQNVNSLFVDKMADNKSESKIYFFKETFYQWLINHGFVEKENENEGSAD